MPASKNTLVVCMLTWSSSSSTLTLSSGLLPAAFSNCVQCEVSRTNRV